MEANTYLRRSANFKDDGRKLFQSGQFTEAIECYQKALGVINPDNLLVNLCVNISLCYHKIDDYPSSLIYSTAAYSIDRTSEKAYFRIVFALEKMKEAALALSFLESFNFSASSLHLSSLKKRCVSAMGGAVQEFLQPCEIVTQLFGIFADRLIGTPSPITCKEKGEEGLTFQIINNMKREADELFRGSKFQLALLKYIKTLRLLTSGCLIEEEAPDIFSASLFLNNIALCHVSTDGGLNEIVEAFFACITAQLLNSSPEYWKPCARLSEVILLLDDPFDAMDVYSSCAFQVSKQHLKSLQSLKQRIDKALKNKNLTPMIKGESRKLTAERTKKKLEDGKRASLESERLCNSMYQSLEVQSGFAMVDDRVVPFHIDYLKRGNKFPVGCDHKQCCLFLERHFECKRGIPMFEYDLITKNTKEAQTTDVINRFGYFMGDQTSDYSDFAKRFAHMKAGEWMKKSEILFDNYETGKEVLQVMSNCCHFEHLVFKKGRTHVAVGFVDLGCLLFSDIADDTVGVVSSMEPTRYVRERGKCL